MVDRIAVIDRGEPAVAVRHLGAAIAVEVVAGQTGLATERWSDPRKEDRR